MAEDKDNAMTGEAKLNAWDLARYIVLSFRSVVPDDALAALPLTDWYGVATGDWKPLVALEACIAIPHAVSFIAGKAAEVAASRLRLGPA
jgi:hypothetical protein